MRVGQLMTTTQTKRYDAIMENTYRYVQIYTYTYRQIYVPLGDFRLKYNNAPMIDSKLTRSKCVYSRIAGTHFTGKKCKLLEAATSSTQQESYVSLVCHTIHWSDIIQSKLKLFAKARQRTGRNRHLLLPAAAGTRAHESNWKLEEWAYHIAR